jgi:hypothetical protein
MSLSPIVTVRVSGLPNWLSGKPTNQYVHVPNSRIYEPGQGLYLNTRLPNGAQMIALEVINASTWNFNLKQQMSADPNDYVQLSSSVPGLHAFLGYSGCAINDAGVWCVAGPGGGGCAGANGLWTFPILAENPAYQAPVQPSHLRYQHNGAYGGAQYGPNYVTAFNWSGTSVTWSSATLDSVLVAQGGVAWPAWPGQPMHYWLRRVANGSGTAHVSQSEAIAGVNPVSRSASGTLEFYPAGVPPKEPHETTLDGRKNAGHTYCTQVWNRQLGAAGRYRFLGMQQAWEHDSGKFTGTWSWAQGDADLTRDETTAPIGGSWALSATVDQETGAEYAFGNVFRVRPLGQPWQVPAGYSDSMRSGYDLSKGLSCFAKLTSGTKLILANSASGAGSQWWVWNLTTQALTNLTLTGPAASFVTPNPEDEGLTWNPHLQEFNYYQRDDYIYTMTISGSNLNVTRFQPTGVGPDWAYSDTSGIFSKFQYVPAAKSLLLQISASQPMMLIRRS